MLLSTEVPAIPGGSRTDAARVIAGNALVGYLGSISLTALRFVTKLVLIRTLDPADFGRVITTQNVQALALTVASLGIGDAVWRFVAMYAHDGTGRAKGVVQQAAKFLMATGVLATVLLLASAGWLSSRLGLGPGGPSGVAIAALALIPVLVGDMLGYAFLGLNRTIVKVGWLDVSRALFTVGGYGLIAGLGWATYRGALSVQLAAAVLSIGCILVALRRAPQFKAPAAHVPLRTLLAYGVPIFASLIIGGTLVNNGIPLMLAAHDAPQAVAMYAIALTLAPLLQLPAGALENAALAVWAGSLGSQAEADLQRSFSQLTRWGVLLALLVYVPLAVAPRDFMELLFGNQYAVALPAIEIALAATFFSVLVGPTQGLLQARGLAGPILVMRTISGLSALLLAWPLVERWGLTGAMIAWAVSTVIGNGVSAIYLFHAHRINPIDTRYLRATLAGASGWLVSLAVLASGVEGVQKVAAVIVANGLTLALVGRLLRAWHPSEFAALVRKSRPEH